ncbi:MAG: hypothetical protein IPH94_10035 [Saprospiraceae bacterium]|nr:hypothetical protein [Saprospiraceae bacterium]
MKSILFYDLSLPIAKQTLFSTNLNKEKRPKFKDLYKHIRLVLSLLIFNPLLIFAQQPNTKIIDIAISYDQFFVDKYGTETFNKINEIQDYLYTFYDDHGITFNFVGIVRFNLGYTTNSYSMRSQAAAAWKNVCLDRDMVHHLTSIPNLGRGESSGPNLCEVNYIDDIIISFSNHDNDNGVDWYSTLHEIGHDFGFNHVGEGLCSTGNYLMCEQGPPNNNNSPILLTQEQEAILNTGITPQSDPCAFQPANVDCKFCDVLATYKIDKEFVELGCGGDNIRLVNIDIKNDCIKQRVVSATITFYPSNVTPLLISPEFIGPSIVYENINGINIEKHSYSYNGVLLKDEEECYDFKFEIKDGILYSDNTYGTDIKCLTSVTFAPNDYDFGETFNLRYKKLVDLTAVNSVAVNDINNECQCLTLDPPGDSFCKNGRPIKIDFGGIFEVDRQIRFCNNCVLTFQENSEVYIKQGGELELNGTYLFSCGSKLWKGITVESGGHLIIGEGTIISDALNGINIKPGAIVEIRNSYLNDNYIGINLNSGAKLDLIENTTIQTLNGVKATNHLNSEYWSQYTYCGILLNPGSFLNMGQDYDGQSSLNHFKNINLGIYAQSSTVLCSNANFEGIQKRLPWVSQVGSAIYLKNSLYNFIWKNNINNSFDGIRGYKSALLCEENTIDVENIGIGSIINEGKYTIINNNRISSKFTCIDGFYIGKGKILNNNLDIVNSISEIHTSGINIRNLTSSEISGNAVIFDQPKNKQFAIILNGGVRNVISENFVSNHFGTQESRIGFALLSGNRNDLKCNISYDFFNGIFIDNSIGNEITCNAVDSHLEDIRVDRNSLMQMMKGNSMNSIFKNLILTNPIGIQSHHGNKWYSTSELGADASILSQTEVQLSEFRYDKTKSDNLNKKWYPIDGNNQVNSAPNYLFFDQPEISTTFECSSCEEGDFFQWFNSNPSPTALCQWLKSITVRISPKRVTWWKNYIYRLIKKSGIPYNQLSQCLKDLIIELEGKKLLHVENLRDNIEQLSMVYYTPTIEARYEELNTLINIARASNVPINNQAFAARLNELQLIIDSSYINLATLKSNILSSLSMFSNDAEYEEEHTLYTTLPDYVLNDVIPQNKFALENYASNCSEEYGENVYLAKALLSITEKIDPVSLSCEEAEDRSRIVTDNIADDIIIRPTISNGLFTVFISNKSVYELTILNSVGNLIEGISNISEYYELDLSNKINGLYLLVLKDTKNGSVIVKKVIKQ